MHEVDVFLGLGSNLGDSKKNVLSAITQLRKLKDAAFIQHSKLYKTSPVNCIAENDFINAVCHLRTHLSPNLLFGKTQAIEDNIGKVKKDKNQPRVIDIDILFYGDQKYESKELHIPHPNWKDRLFVLIPLSDLIDEIFVPVGNKSFPFRIKECIRTFSNHTNETIEVIDHA